MSEYLKYLLPAAFVAVVGGLAGYAVWAVWYTLSGREQRDSKVKQAVAVYRYLERYDTDDYDELQVLLGPFQDAYTSGHEDVA